jgi:hypothetical protein
MKQMEEFFKIFGDLVLRSWKERGKVYLLMETGRG